MTLTRRESFLAIYSVLVSSIAANAIGLPPPPLTPTPPDPFAPFHFQPNRLGMGWILSGEDISRLGQLAQANIDETTFEIREGVDHFGGDLSAFRALSSGDCAAACASDPACTRFTFATEKHDVASKRKMCWLKDDSVLRSKANAGAYLSGQKR